MPPRTFFQRDPESLAKALLGQHLVRVIANQRLVGRIVEVEAYLGVKDKAAHTYAGRRTPRNEAIWGPAGHAYVYFTYGMHHCMNVVAGDVDVPVAVLIRALEPVEGLDAMHAHRLKASRPIDLCSGPAKLCQAMSIDKNLNGADLVSGLSLTIEQTRARTLPARMIATGPRIGVDYADDWAQKPLRFWVKDNPHVSR